MENDFNEMLLKVSRHHMHDIWQAAKKNDLDGLNEEDTLFAKIMLEHEDEYYNDFEMADVLDDYRYDPETETNPFMHVIIHTVVEKQLKDKKPIETFQFYNAMINKKASRHDTIHMIGNIFTYFLYYTLKEKTPFNNDAYRKVLKLFQNKKPTKIWAAIDRGLDQYTDI